MNFIKIYINICVIIINMFLITNFIYCQEYTLEFKISDDKNIIENKYKSYESLVLSIDDSISLLKSQGYISAKVESFIKNDSFNYDVSIKKNNKIMFVEIINIMDLDFEIISIFNKYKQSNNYIKFEESEFFLKNLAELFSKKGFPFADIKLVFKDVLNEELVQSEINIELGTRRYYDKIIVKGYENFPEKFLKNIFFKKKNNFLDINLLKSESNKINRLQFARKIKDPEILFTNDSTSIYLYIEKIRRNSFDGIIGFDSDENSGKINFQGYANINLLNTFNRGEIINFNYNANKNQDRSINSQIYIPFFLSSKINMRIGLNLIQKDSTFQSRESLIELDKNFGKIKTGIGIQKIKSNSNQIFENIENYESNLLNFFSGYNQSDYYESHFSDDFKFLLKYTYGRKKQLQDRAKTEKIKIEIVKKFNFSSKLKFDTKFKSEKIKSKNLVNNELLRIGGMNSIRGFDENAILTNEYHLLNTNLNYYLNDNIYIYSIFDLAEYNNEIINLKEHIYSGGFGFTSKTESGIISVNYSKGNFWGNKFSLKNAILSVNFISFF